MQPISWTVQSGFQSLFLAALPDEEQERLLAHLEPVTLLGEDSLYVQDDSINYVYFPLDCIVSSLAVMNDGATVEIGMMGREAVIGIAAIFGEYKARNWMRVLIPGQALRLRSAVLREIFHQSVVFERLLMRSYRAMVTQISQRAVCNGRHTMLQRLATWLLMVHDRVGSENIPLTQETISGRLGSRRASITQAACFLQNIHAISYTRGKIHINDRASIQAKACECYEVIRNEFDCLKAWGEDAQNFNSGGSQLAIKTRLRDLR
jgi:CRP-like cAMP-binding protein